MCCYPELIKARFFTTCRRADGRVFIDDGRPPYALGVCAVVVPLALHGFGWRGALLMLMLFSLLAFLIWLPQWRTARSANLSGSRHSMNAVSGVRLWHGKVTLFWDLTRDLLCDYRLVTSNTHQPRLQLKHRQDRYTRPAAAGDRGARVQLFRLFCLFNDQRWIAALVSLLCAVGAAGLWFVPGGRSSGRYCSASVQARRSSA